MTKLLKTIIAVIAIATAILLLVGFNAGESVESLSEKYLYPESKFVNIDGINVHYRETGDNNKPTLVLMHGVASSLHTWEGWNDVLAKDFHVIAFDVPGFGLTGPFSDNVYSKEHYMQFMDKFFDALNINSMYLGGNSFGGYLTWNYALHNPQRVKKLILIDSSGMKDTVDAGLTEKNIGFVLSTTPLIKYFSWWVTPQFLVRKSVENVYGDPSKVTGELVDRYYSMLVRKGNREAFSAIIPEIRKDESSSAELGKITQPVLILWGDKDKLHVVEEGQNFHAALPNSQFKSYPDLGHVPMEEDPQATVETAQQFLLN